MEIIAEKAETLLKSLANKHRLMVAYSLLDGELSVGQLNERVPLSQSALSQHLGTLRREDVVNTRRESQTIYYSLKDPNVHQILMTLHDLFAAKSPLAPSSNALPVRDLLIVEDDSQFRLTLEEALEDLGSIEICGDAESAREKLAEYRFRIVLSDVVMPGEDGVSLLDHVRRSQTHCYRILVTGHADLEILQKAVNEAQAHKIFYKPFSLDVLEPVLTEYLSQSRALSQLASVSV